MNGCFLSGTFTAKLDFVFALTFENSYSQSFHFKDNRENIGLVRNGIRDFKNSPPFERLTYFYVIINESFKCFQHFDLGTNLLENKNPLKSWSIIFQLKPLRLKTHHFHSKLHCQKPTLRQLERRLQNGPLTNSGVLAVTTLFSWKFFSSFRTS